MSNLVSLTHSSFPVLDKSQAGVFQFPDLIKESLKKENFHNSRTSDNIDTKLNAVTKLDKRSRITLKNSNDDFMSGNSNVTAIFSIYREPGENSDTRFRMDSL